ncbi:MAG TPA: hypothetical protein VFU94_10625 [Conexibacter sp.]|nr:hypothetical protein [Conexibacter sp.]
MADAVAGAGAVLQLAGRHAVGTEPTDTIDGHALGEVGGERVGVMEVALGEVVDAEHDVAAVAVHADGQMLTVVVDVDDLAAGAVVKSSVGAVAPADHEIAEREAAIGDGQLGAGEVTVLPSAPLIFAIDNTHHPAHAHTENAVSASVWKVFNA